MNTATLRRFLDHPDCVIFVGSGLSIWSGLPSWRSLIRSLADLMDTQGIPSTLVRRELDSGDLLQAASFGASKLTPPMFRAFMHSVIRPSQTTPHAIHRALVELGPTSFITTNYDSLIEQSLAQWKPGTFFPPPVTNKQLVELAEIIRARSSHFVFKPHGDINDTSSIVLTREHYRTLLPGGDRHSALESLKTLLVTRPVFYVGFGLRDPDFLLLRDLLLNIYQGAVRDHWAVMPDISPDEADYWRREYGINLFSYETTARPDGSRDHGALLTLLQQLAASALQTPLVRTHSQTSTLPIDDAARVLALTRYASGLIQRFAYAAESAVIRITQFKDLRGIQAKYDPDGFEGWPVSRFLAKGPAESYLIGGPGSGKTFALQNATYHLAKRLLQSCIDDRNLDQTLIIPLFLDLKFYQGDLQTLIDNELPAGCTLQQLQGTCGVKLYLDAFNEMQSQFIEQSLLFKALEELRGRIPGLEYMISSRTTDGLSENRQMFVYELDHFDSEYVDTVLRREGIQLTGEFESDIRSLLSRPFFLNLVAGHRVDVPSNARPRDVFSSFVKHLQSQFDERFGPSLTLITVFSKVAFRVVESEQEAFPLVWLTDLLGYHLRDRDLDELDVNDVVNWLVSRDVLVPHSGRRASFIHQSLTEYCAAVELARRFETDITYVREILSSKKWDECLFLALALSHSEVAELVLREGIYTDYTLAVNAIRYCEEGRINAVTRLLSDIFNRFKDRENNLFLGASITRLPVTNAHAPLLRKLISLGGAVGGESVILLSHLLGADIKAELLDLLVTRSDDYNFSVNGVARALRHMIEERDLPHLLSIASDIWRKGNKDSLSGIGELVSNLPFSVIAKAVGDAESESVPHLVVFGDALRKQRSTGSFELIASLMLKHPDVFVSDFCISFPWDDDPFKDKKLHVLGYEHVDALWSARSKSSLWHHALESMCRSKAELAEYTLRCAEKHAGVEEISLRYCADPSDPALIMLVRSLLSMDDQVLSVQPFGIFPFSQLDWEGQEELFCRSVARGIPDLRKSLLTEQVTSLRLAEKSLTADRIKPILKLIETLGITPDTWWDFHQLALLVAKFGDVSARETCLAALTGNQPNLKTWAKRFYVGLTIGLTTDDLNEDMLSVLLSDLNVIGGVNEFFWNPLGSIATDKFVVERLLPLAEGASKIVLDNLKLVLTAAGNRHRKRYLLPNQPPTPNSGK